MKHINKGVNPISVNEIFFSGMYFCPGIRIGVVSGVIALTVRRLCPTSLTTKSFFVLQNLEDIQFNEKVSSECRKL